MQKLPAIEESERWKPSTSAWVFTVLATSFMTPFSLLFALAIAAGPIGYTDLPRSQIVIVFLIVAPGRALGAAFLMAWGIATMFGAPVARVTVCVVVGLITSVFALYLFALSQVQLR